MSILSELAEENTRLMALRNLEMLDALPEAEFEVIMAGSRLLFGCKMAFVSLVDSEWQCFNASCGLGISEAERGISFCAQVVAADHMLVIEDTLRNELFAANPLVSGPPYIRFYAGVPLHVKGPAGENLLPIGTLYVADDRPHAPSSDRLALLQGMAHVIETLLESRRLSRESLRLGLERQDALDEMARRQSMLQHAERMAQMGSWRLELATGHVHWSDQAYAVHGLQPASEKMLDDVLVFYPKADQMTLRAALAACADQGTPWDLELDLTDAKQKQRRVRIIGEVDQRDGERVAVMGVIQDITDRYRLERRLYEVARTDELTGISTRRAFNEEINRALKDAGEPFAIAIIDLDRFKEVNDRLGHHAGDQVLQLMADRLRSTVYLGDHFTARLGGDEFALLLRDGHALNTLAQGMERLLADLVHRVKVSGGADIHVTATIGACVHGPEFPDRASLLRGADEALYRAKAARRGTAAIAGRERLLDPTFV